MGLRTKIVIIGLVQLFLLSTVLLVLYYYQSRDSTREQFVEKARSIVLAAESAREEMGKKWDQGVFSADQLGAWLREGKMDKILAAVPVVSAWNTAMMKAEEGGYKFRVPKFSARNPKNEPDSVESEVLKLFESKGLKEHFLIDKKMNAVRYFRPIRLTTECLLCHGDPATSAKLWGNDRGLDPTGVRMENWKEGEVHGAFEVIQSLDAADAAMAASLWKGGSLVAGLGLTAAALFFLLITRSVVRPINRLVADLNEGADQVSDAAGQVASSSQHLAEGASDQASSLEETSSALEEMSAMTRTNAENAKMANELSGRARNAAQAGDETMTLLNSAMTAINDSSGQISKIIKVIESIAFQTNLLALNAAVEAARAGEHGKGFAVVAEEVRNLAKRCAEAARETTTLIEDSVNKAKEGADVANKVGDAFGTIVGDVTKVTELINGIAQACQEQSQGVDQITSAASQMDRVTQQNAAAAEESASAAEELTSMALSLKDVFVADMTAVVHGTKRRSRREFYVEKAVVESKSQGEPVSVPAITRDRSKHGIGVSSKKPLDVGSPAEIALPGEAEHETGRIARCDRAADGSYTVGVEYKRTR